MKKEFLIGAIGFMTVLGCLMVIAGAYQLIAQPTVTQSYGLTFERDDFTGTVGQTTFSTAVAPRSTFVLVYRNGLLQRPGAVCTATPRPCDYTPSPNGQIATFPPGVIGAGDFITLLFYR